MTPELRLTPEEYDALWVCGYCDRRFVVPNLARDCESSHERS